MDASHAERISPNEAAPARQPTRGEFILPTLIAATVAASAAALVRGLSLETWVMFVGFITWFTRPTSTRASVSAMICLGLGLLLGLASNIATVALMPAIGGLALPLVVFAVAFWVMTLRATPVVDNVLSWFLGVVTFFAAGLKPEFEAFAEVGLACAIGGFAGWACHALSHRLVKP